MKVEPGCWESLKNVAAQAAGAAGCLQRFGDGSSGRSHSSTSASDDPVQPERGGGRTTRCLIGSGFRFMTGVRIYRNSEIFPENDPEGPVYVIRTPGGAQGFAWGTFAAYL